MLLLLKKKYETRVMKTNTIKNLVMLGAFAGFAFYISRNYRQRKQRERELRETLHFQLF
ncbi:MAG: hypothetical protein XD92_1418 [Proteiniphilum acetatigenes]|uniref:Uncharacterized protein n=1 Tax=Proteiniphilum acetatigenes TaxID=294710 RepID=A0A101HFQ9_9BACT|nr:MAG: hypothetical protein XD92_1418 [Proteiniphilum acetatigenes]